MATPRGRATRSKTARPPRSPAPQGRPRRRWLWRSLGLLVSAVVFLWCAGFLWFLLNAFRPSVPPVHADGIVVLTGGGERLHTAFDLLAQHRADRLLISGVPQNVGVADIARTTNIARPPDGSHITLGHRAQTTLGNAEETAAWVSKHQIRSLIVVTAGYHMPRALLELSRLMPDVQLYPMRVQPPAIYDGSRVEIWRLMVSEYTKWLLAQVDVSHTLAQTHRESLS